MTLKMIEIAAGSMASKELKRNMLALQSPKNLELSPEP